MHQRTYKSNSSNSPSQEKGSQFFRHSSIVQAKQNSYTPPTQEEMENNTFCQNKFEAVGLQIKQTNGTITPIEQERLGVLQAKMDDVLAKRVERAKRFGHHLANISLHSPDRPVSTPVQPKLPFGLSRVSDMQQTAQKSSDTSRHGGMSLVQRISTARNHLGSPIQAKLTIGQPGDKYEQEADRVAQQVMQQLNAPNAKSMQSEQGVQRESLPEEDELQMKPLAQHIQRVEIPDEDELQMKPIVMRSPHRAMDASADLENAINRNRGIGQPLDAGLQQSMGQAFGADFSGVRVHADAQSDRLNRSIQARAFTTGQDVFFRQGAYQPGSHRGQELIAHELTHVVQQNGGALRRFASEHGEHIQRLIIAKDDDSPNPVPLSIEVIQQNIQNLPQEVQNIIWEIYDDDQYAMTLAQAIELAISEAAHGELVSEDQGMESESSEAYEERIIGGHGGFEERNLLAKEGSRGKETHYKLPPGVEVVMYAPDGAWLDNPVANAIEIGSPLANDEVVLESSQSPYYKNMPAEYPKTFTTGESIINYTIKPPGNLKIEGEHTILVKQAMPLSVVIEQHKSSSGKTMKFHIAVCAVGGVPSGSKYSNLFKGGAGYAVVRRADVAHKQKYQIWLSKN